MRAKCYSSTRPCQGRGAGATPAVRVRLPVGQVVDPERSVKPIPERGQEGATPSWEIVAPVVVCLRYLPVIVTRKRCRRCGRRRLLKFFARRSKGSEKRHSYCYKCHHRYKMEWRRGSPRARQKNQEYSRVARQRLVTEIDAIKSVPCTDCKVQFKPWQMTFDHVRGRKIADVSTLVSAGRRKAALAEIEKCEVVCANCHADRTHSRNHAGVVQ